MYICPLVTVFLMLVWGGPLSGGTDPGALFQSLDEGGGMVCEFLVRIAVPGLGIM